MKIDIPLLGSKPRSCGTCTKCCEGYLTGNIEGHPMSYGVPCHFLQQGVGCKRYETRPNNPCKTFTCGWLDDKKIPDFIKPEICGVIIVERVIHENTYSVFIQAPNQIEGEFLDWAKEYYKKNKKNYLYYDANGKIHYAGSKEFLREIKGHENQFKDKE